MNEVWHEGSVACIGQTKVQMGWREAIELLVRPVVVVVDEVLGQELVQFVAVNGAVAVNTLLFDAPPEPLDEGVVGGTALSVHADLDALLEQCPGELIAGVLTAMVGVI